MNLYIFINGIVAEKSTSGGDQIALNLLQYFLKKGHHINIFTSKQGKKRFINLGLKTTIIDKTNLVEVNTFLAYIYRTLNASLRALKVNPALDSSIYASSDSIVDCIPALIMKLKNKKTKMFCGVNMLAPNPFKGYRDKYSIFPNLSLLYFYLTQNIMLYFLKKVVDFVYVVNFPDKKTLIKKGFRKNKIIVIYPGVNLKLLYQKKQVKKFDAVWTGRLHIQKGIDDLFLCWAWVCKNLPKAKLLVIGEKKLKKYFLSLPFTKKIKKNVFFTGFLEGKMYFKTLAKAKIFIFPSYYESFSIVILDAMACGLPVICYNLEVYQKIYTQGVIKIAKGQVSDFSQKVLSLLRNKNKRSVLSSQAIKHSQNFNWEKAGDKILQKLNEK